MKKDINKQQTQKLLSKIAQTFGRLVGAIWSHDRQRSRIYCEFNTAAIVKPGGQRTSCRTIRTITKA